MLRTLVLSIVFVTTTCAGAHAQILAVYADSMGVSTCIETPLPPVLDLYVIFKPGGFANEMQGAQFRLDGLPTDWMVQSSTPNPLISASVGDPFQLGWGECSLAFEDCQQGMVMLWKANLLAWPAVDNHPIEIVGQSFCPGGHACFGPMVNLCDAPVFTSIVLAESISMVNPSNGCTVSVESSSWAAVKFLFR